MGRSPYRFAWREPGAYLLAGGSVYKLAIDEQLHGKGQWEEQEGLV